MNGLPSTALMAFCCTLLLNCWCPNMRRSSWSRRCLASAEFSFGSAFSKLSLSAMVLLLMIGGGGGSCLSLDTADLSTEVEDVVSGCLRSFVGGLKNQDRRKKIEEGGGENSQLSGIFVWKSPFQGCKYICYQSAFFLIFLTLCKIVSP